MYEFICDHVVPGCTHKETGPTEAAVREKAIAHLHEHHDMDYIDEDAAGRIPAAIIRLPR